MKLKKVFYSLIIVFVLTMVFFLLQNRLSFIIAAVLGLIFTILGICFIILVKKSKQKKKLFLYMTGISAASILPSVILHNAFYAFGILAENVLVLRYIFGFLEVSFFLIGVLIAPIGFLVGIIGTLVKWKK